MKKPDERPDLTPSYEEFVDLYLLEPRDRKNSVYNALVHKIARQVRAHIVQENLDQFVFNERIHEALGVLQRVRDSVRRELAENKKFPNWTDEQHNLWHHEDVDKVYDEGIDSKHFRWVDVEALAEAAERYLNLPCMQNDFLEWVMLDAFIYAEVEGTGSITKQLRVGAIGPTGLGTRLIMTEQFFENRGTLEFVLKRENYVALRKYLTYLAVYGGLTLVAYLALQWLGMGTAANFVGATSIGCFIGSSFLAYRIGKSVVPHITNGFMRKGTPEGKLADLLSDMSIAYRVLGHPMSNPGLLRHHLLFTASKGAVWNPAIFSLLDAVIARNQSTWPRQT